MSLESRLGLFNRTLCAQCGWLTKQTSVEIETETTKEDVSDQCKFIQYFGSEIAQADCSHVQSVLAMYIHRSLIYNDTCMVFQRSKT